MDRSTASVLPRRSVLGGALGLLGASCLPYLAGCAATSPEGGGKMTEQIELLSAGMARTPMTISDAPDLTSVVAGMRELGTGLHRVSATAAANWTASPLSISLAFGMLRAGARGRTARQIDVAMGYPPTAAREGSPHAALNALSAALVSAGPSILAIANGLFLDRAFAPDVRPDYLTLLARQYGADAMAVRFADPSTVETINAWVAEQTRGRITTLFDHLDPATVMVLADAVYLKATWQSKFTPSNTTTGAFHRATGDTVQVPLMRQTQFARYAATAQWQRITLPYDAHDLAMHIVLPRGTAGDVPALTAALTAALAPNTSDAATSVDLTLPRWETTTTVALRSALQALGVTDVFDAAADLSGIAPQLFVSDAVHRAFVTVDENGTEAAAVTGIDIAVTGVAADPVRMIVDRPFAWAVVHEPTGTPVFAGHLVDPG